MPRKKTEDNSEVLDGINLDDAVIEEELADEEIVIEEIPSMNDPGWSEYVLKQFAEDERDEQGNVLVAGLRRVTRKVLGPILESTAKVVQSPTFKDPASPVMIPAVVEYTVVVRMLDDEGNYYNAKFTDAADVFCSNTDTQFLIYPTATAATRAEARALRKALQLQRVVSSEETSKIDPEDTGIGGCITTTQINFLAVLGKRNDINIMKVVNSGKRHYASIHDVPYDTAAKILEYISGLQTQEKPIDKKFQGFDPDFSKEN